jgi:hypothetical protein
MATEYKNIDFFYILSGVNVDGTHSLAWTDCSLNETANLKVVDSNSDGDLDIGVDYVQNSSITFTGFYITANNKHFGIYSNGLAYYVPHHGDLDLSGSGFTDQYSDNLALFSISKF